MIRSTINPVITRHDIITGHASLQDVSSVFNPGGIKIGDMILLLLRVQNRARETFLLRAFSRDGTSFAIDEKPVMFTGLGDLDLELYHIYDPRITLLGDTWHVLTAIDTNKGCFCGHFLTEDFSELRLLSLDTAQEMRNAVLFPEMIQGHYWRFERPNNYVGEDGVATGNVITCSVSEDLKAWINRGLVMKGNPHYWDELIGSGPPPLKTRNGWLHLYHGVATHFGSANIYQAGASLHALDDPQIVIGRTKYNILEPRELYEITGQVPNVVFPTAAIAMETDAEGFVAEDSDILVYYGAADTCVCLAITDLKYLMESLYA
ncbi:MAG TPA: glycoside hydrolase family 130 protein [Candidatus Cloacimonadota bacterium]|nr:glycoside hydrolase family 130 protein [Candidatus Cloacimonadota bacterium]